MCYGAGLAQVAQLNVPYVLMHMRGDPTTMQQLTTYSDTCVEVGQELQAQAQAALDAGIEPWRIILDPGVQAVLCKLAMLAAAVAEVSDNPVSVQLGHYSSREACCAVSAGSSTRSSQ